MAVAVKNPPIVGAASPFDRLPIVSLVGAAYVAVSLGVVLDGLPYLWRTYTGLTDVGGDILLGLIMLAVATALAVLGVRLYGGRRPAGARAGVFMGLAGILIVLLLARWASLWLEYGIYANGWFGNSPIAGLAATAVVAALLLAGEVYLFMQPRTEAFLVGLEGAGVVHRELLQGPAGPARPPRHHPRHPAHGRLRRLHDDEQRLPPPPAAEPVSEHSLHRHGPGAGPRRRRPGRAYQEAPRKGQR